MIIEDGTGKGYAAGVSDENRLLTDAVQATIEHHVNHLVGQAYHLLFDQAPTAGDDCILYVENTSDTDICVEGFYLSVSGAGEVYFHLGDTGTRNAATDVVPVNCNAGSGHTADGVFEVGADLDGGAATLAGGDELERYVFQAATDSAYINFEQDVIIPKNRTLTVWADSIITITGNMVFNFHDIH